MSLLGLVLVGLAALADVEAPVTARVGLVIGQNTTDEAGVDPLHFADDDAIATHRLLREAQIDALLLVGIDSETRALHPDLQPFGVPARERLLAAISTLRTQVEAARALGRSTELVLFYSGHGGIDAGEGYVALADGRLTRRELWREVLAGIGADRNHVVIDACKSYFMAYAKGTGGKRAAFAGGVATDLMPPANTGFVLSTSSGADSHEWERFQAGVFSHEVRSALRGAADADLDGQVSYAELGAFLNVANAAIVNARFRPDFLVRAPGDLELPLLVWPDTAETLAVDLPSVGHLYLESRTGERLADLNPAPGQRLALRVPRERPIFIRDVKARSERILAGGGGGRLSALKARPTSVRSKGAEHLAFQTLFRVPFGRAQVAAFTEAYRTGAEMPGLTEAGAPAPASDRLVQHVTGWSALGLAVVGAGMTGWALERRAAADDAPQRLRPGINQTIDRLNLAAAVAYGLAGVAGAGWLTLTLWPASEPEGSSGVGVTWSGQW